MSGPPKSVIIVGGSLAGLMHGIQLKRQGSNVTILEQDPHSERKSDLAGLSFGTNLEDFIRRYDITGAKWGIPASGMRAASGKRVDVFRFPVQRQLTSWGYLYRLLRANLDGLATQACRDPPRAPETDGMAVYRSGQRVTGLTSGDNAVTVQFEDVVTGRESSLSADLVIGADGVHSTIRKLVNAPHKVEYSGYVAWRATIPVSAVSRETAKFFSGVVAWQLLKRSYLVCYRMPTDDGALEPDEQVINWVWYYNIADGSSEMQDIFTDVSGVRHEKTVRAGLVRPEVWAQYRDLAVPLMISPYAEVVQKSSTPFVTKVTDDICTESRFLNGRVQLVGDALATVRPHLGMAADHAAWHCVTMEKVWRGEATQEQCDRELLFEKRRFWWLSRIIGVFGTGSRLALVRTIVLYVWFLIKWKILRRMSG
ncbi:FAD binding domain-containing protein [Thozetella sp. PMI_491]|nr:FAD binding domain-containing protein [Thozetella sp. PMI_491]